MEDVLDFFLKFNEENVIECNKVSVSISWITEQNLRKYMVFRTNSWGFLKSKKTRKSSGSRQFLYRFVESEVLFKDVSGITQKLTSFSIAS